MGAAPRPPPSVSDTESREASFRADVRCCGACARGQVYDQNEPAGFPVLRALLGAAERRRAEGRMPGDWAQGARERCGRWRVATHPAAWGLIEDFELQFEADDPAAWEGGPALGGEGAGPPPAGVGEGGLLVERLAGALRVDSSPPPAPR